MNVDFVTAIKVYFANYANFKGRSTRAEYWWAMLFVFLLNIVVDFFGVPALTAIVSLALFIPNLAVLTRRFHDIGKSGWWVLGYCVISLVISGISFGSIAAAAMAGADLTSAIANSIGTLSVGAIVMLVIGIWVLVWLVKPSGPDNQYGPNPYGE